MKKCTRCLQEKPVSEFGPWSRSRDGLFYYCRVCAVAATKDSDRRLRTKVLEAYGGKCACCGESAEPFLTVDHIDGDGAVHRRGFARNGQSTYRWIIRNGYPAGSQVLCWNCNWGKRLQLVCPHEFLR